jgi:hypothetical protein
METTVTNIKDVSFLGWDSVDGSAATRSTCLSAEQFEELVQVKLRDEGIDFQLQESPDGSRFIVVSTCNPLSRKYRILVDTVPLSAEHVVRMATLSRTIASLNFELSD